MAIAQAISQLDLPEVNSPVIFCYPKYHVHYTCSIAFNLSQKSDQTPLDIAHLLQTQLRNLVKDKLTITVGNLGVLNFCLTARYLTACLEQVLLTLDPDLNNQDILQIDQPKFKGYTHVQYAYARCRSMLRILTELASPKSDIQIEISGEEWALGLHLVAIAETLNPNSDQQVAIKTLQHLTTEFMKFSDRTSTIPANLGSISHRILMLRITQTIIASLTSDLIRIKA